MALTAAPTSPNVNDRELKRLLARKRGLTDQQLSQMSGAIRPVVSDGKSLSYIKAVDPRSVSFIWSAQPESEATGLREFARIITLHSFGFVGFFKPSIAEVLSMIPTAMVAKAKAFQTIGPEDINDLNRQRPANVACYHAATTILYY